MPLVCERVRWSGALFSYASVETQVLGLVLRSVVGRPVAEYFRDRIWEPIGAEADATWIIDASGQEALGLTIPQSLLQRADQVIE
jgi:CubicO group peptidase (beta-lactamase class C family)